MANMTRGEYCCNIMWEALYGINSSAPYFPKLSKSVSEHNKYVAIIIKARISLEG
jgi:hypothetical protein